MAGSTCRSMPCGRASSAASASCRATTRRASAIPSGAKRTMRSTLPPRRSELRLIAGLAGWGAAAWVGESVAEGAAGDASSGEGVILVGKVPSGGLSAVGGGWRLHSLARQLTSPGNSCRTSAIALQGPFSEADAGPLGSPNGTLIDEAGLALPKEARSVGGAGWAEAVRMMTALRKSTRCPALSVSCPPPAPEWHPGQPRLTTVCPPQMPVGRPAAARLHCRCISVHADGACVWRCSGQRDTPAWQHAHEWGPVPPLFLEWAQAVYYQHRSACRAALCYDTMITSTSKERGWAPAAAGRRPRGGPGRCPAGRPGSAGGGAGGPSALRRRRRDRSGPAGPPPAGSGCSCRCTPPC